MAEVRKRRVELQVNMTPLIDVVFLLLIFFMVSTSFTRETQLKVELPEANGAPLDIAPDLIEISIDREGRYFVNRKALVNTQMETLRKALADLSAGKLDTPVIISADAKAPFQSAITAMDAAGQVGLSNLTMATQEPDQQ